MDTKTNAIIAAAGVLVLVVGGFLAGGVAFGDLRSRVAALEQPTFQAPQGAVVAFNLAECPSEWRPLDDAEGRFIVGVGQHSVHNAFGNDVPVKNLGDRGGEDQVRLGIEQMPNHFHDNPTSGSGSAARVWALEISQRGELGGRHRRPTDARGEGQPYNNMPPYLALLYCVRD